MRTFLEDLRYALRMLRKSPALALVAVCTLALGIGVNIALFTVIDATLLRPLPVKNAHQLVVLANRDRHFEFPHGLSNLQLQDFRHRTAVFSDLAGVFPFAVNMTVAGQPQRTFVDYTTSSFFSMLGVQAARGRLYTEPEITQPKAAPVMVISDGFWRRGFGADPSVVGKPVTINGETVTVAGILPPTFPGVEIVTIDAYLPIEQAGHGPNREDFLHLLRVALGADRGDVLRLVIRQGMILTAAGVVIGVGLALLLGQVLSTLLYGVTGLDPLTIAAVLVLLPCIAMLASYLPARKAMAVDPMVALRYE